MQSEVRAEMCSEMQREELIETARAQCPRLLRVYARLAARGEHLFTSVLAGLSPRQWEHYPADDAVDRTTGYQWFYHSHSPEDRPGSAEHGHIHLFARRTLWARRLQSRSEKAFAALCGRPLTDHRMTRHLLGISFDAKGIPANLFTVNSWVTGDSMLSSPLTLQLLDRMHLATGHPAVDTVIESVVRLCRPEAAQLLARRDAALASHPGPDKLMDRHLEVLSEVPIDLDTRMQDIRRRSGSVPQSRAETRSRAQRAAPPEDSVRQTHDAGSDLVVKYASAPTP